ncbi:MAG: metalloregulator ArsR/SmtB family transcription factor [Bacillota bacterium]|nr:metalloregulator ArsR/SmtB family transcription factor [Bacillota bacterium]
MSGYGNEVIEASEVFKALGHPTRVCILSKLRFSSLNVSQMQECLEISQSNVSQHLNILRNRKIIVGERRGTEVIYSLTDDRVKLMIEMFFEK